MVILGHGSDPDPGPARAEARARAYVTHVLQPSEAEFERPGGRVPRDGANPPVGRRSRLGSRRFLPAEAGGQGWSALDQVLVHEQFGQATGGLWSYIPGAYNVLIYCDAEAARPLPRPVQPRGERLRELRRSPRTAPGSDPRTLQATAVRDAATGDYVLNGEKWFVTGPDFRLFLFQ